MKSEASTATKATDKQLARGKTLLLDSLVHLTSLTLGGPRPTIRDISSRGTQSTRIDQTGVSYPIHIGFFAL